MAPGVSSTISSTPVACSSARMLRPSRPMMRPFMSSLGRSTTETVVSMACSAALRWMASVMMCRARSAAHSRASVSSRFTSLAASRRASDSICLSSRSRASSAVRLAMRCSSRCRSARTCSARVAAASLRWRSSPSAVSRARSSRSSFSTAGDPIGEGRGCDRPAPVPGRRSPAGARAPCGRRRRGARATSRALRAGLLFSGNRLRARPAAASAGRALRRGRWFRPRAACGWRYHQTMAPIVRRSATAETKTARYTPIGLIVPSIC